MRSVLTIFALLSFTAMGATPATEAVQKVEVTKAPPLIDVRPDSPVAAHIDPATLKITYEKGADPKAVAEQIMKLWAQAQADLGNKLQQCQAQLAKEKK